MKKKYKAIAAYGDDAYEIMEDHRGETHTAKEWYDIYSEAWKGEYNPTEILEFNSREELEAATDDPGGIIPVYYQTEGITDSL